MSIGETLSRLLLKRLVDDVFTTGGVEPLDAVVDFLTRCGLHDDPRLTAALQQAMQRAWNAVESALSGWERAGSVSDGATGETPVPPTGETPVPPTGETPVPPTGERPVPPTGETLVPPTGERPVPPTGETPVPPTGETPVPPTGERPVPPTGETPVPPSAVADASGSFQSLRQCLGRVLVELAHGGCVKDRPTVLVVANALRRQCSDDLRCAHAGGALAGCLDPEEWARSPEVFVRFAAHQGRRTEVQLLRDLEQQGCIGLMRLLTGAGGLPLLLMAARAFLCQELAQLLYFCLQERPEQTPDNCTLVLEILHELSVPRFSIWRKPVPPARPVHWSRLESDGASVYRFARSTPRETINRSAVAHASGSSSWALAAVLTIAVALLVILPIWMLAENAQRYAEERQRAALQRQRVRNERRRIEAEQQRLVEEQERIVRREQARQQALQRQHEEAERRQRIAAEEKRQRAEEKAAEEREQQRRRIAEERRARLREEQQRREQARIALEDGLTQSALRKDREALTTLSEALRLDPGLPRAWSARGAVRRRLGDTAGALVDFHEAVRRDPQDVRAWLQCGEMHAQRREHHQAIDAFTAAIQLQPDSVSAYRQRGLCYGQSDEADKAIADQTKAIELAPDDPWAYFYRANLHRRRNELDRALEDYTAAIRRDRGNNSGLASAYRERGMLYLHWQMQVRAITDLTRALELDRADSSSLRARCLAYLQNGEWTNALLDADELIRHDAEDSAAYKLRGQAYLGLREHRRAHDDFSRALRKGRDAETFYLRARVKVYLGDIQEAIFDCNEATAINPRLAGAFYLRGKLNLREGYRITGLADCRTAHELDPQFPLP